MLLFLLLEACSYILSNQTKRTHLEKSLTGNYKLYITWDDSYLVNRLIP